jgi:uncharacterized membrane protein YdbT with pleckstrin-like domain
MSANGETIVWQGHPSWKALLLYYVKWTLISLIPVAVWVGLNAAGLVLTYVGGWIKRRTTRYLVTDRRIHIRTGLVSRNERTTHVDRVQNVNLRQTILQRMLGIGDVDWDTAGTDAADADFTFRGVDDPSGLVHAADRYYGVAAVHETAQREL